MLEDRDYMRQPEYNEPRWTPRFRFHWSWTVVLLAAYAAVFLSERLTERFFPAQSFFFDYLPLSKTGLEHGYVWQLLTYQFMHAGWLHIFMNSWVIYVFGREVESLLGGKKFLALMFSSGIVGGVFQVLAACVWPQYFDGQGWQNKLAGKYGVESIPFTVLVGADGKIVGTDLRGEALAPAVAKALGK